MRLSAFLLGLLLVAGEVAPAAAAVSRDVTTLPWRRPIELPAALPPGSWIEVREDSVLAAGTSFDVRGIRIVDEGGELIPCAVLEPRLHETHFGSRGTRAVPWDRNREGALEAVLDLGPDRPRTLLLEPLGAGSDRGPFHYETSLDGERWGSVVPERMDFMRAPPEPGNRPRARLELPDRYLKLVAENGVPRSRLPDSLALLSMEIRDAPLEPLSFTVRDARFRGRTWEATLVLEGAPRAIAALVLEVPRPTPAAFPVEVEGELARGGWRRLSRERAPDWSSFTVDTLRIEPMRTGSVRISARNADPPNPPFTIRAVEAVPARWVFPPPAGDAWIAYGDPYLEPRGWGMENRAAWVPAFALAPMGEPEPNPLYAPPRLGPEWLKRHPAVAAAIMVAILLLAGLVVLRGSREPRG